MNLVSLFLSFNTLSVSLAICNSYQLVFMQEENKIEASFFNITVEEAYWDQVCAYLEKADRIELEKEVLIHEEYDEYYVFVEGILMQEIIIQNHWGQVKIPNPEYQYVLNKPQVAQKVDASFLIVATHKVAWVILSTWGIILGILIFILYKL